MVLMLIFYSFIFLLDRISLVMLIEKGLVRQEGKEYVVKDGDIIVFRFNV